MTYIMLYATYYVTHFTLELLGVIALGVLRRSRRKSIYLPVSSYRFMINAESKT